MAAEQVVRKAKSPDILYLMMLDRFAVGLDVDMRIQADLKAFIARAGPNEPGKARVANVGS